MTKLKFSTALVAAGLMAMAAPALAQQTVTPKSGPDINQPKVMPGSPSTSGAGDTNRDNSNIKGGGGDAGNSGGSSGTGASSSGAGAGGSGAGGSGAGGAGSSGSN